MTKFIDTALFSVAYDVYGEGEHGLILLHGYGLDRRSWSNWIDKIQFAGKIICIDLPFHGNTISLVRKTNPIQKSDAADIIKHIIVKEVVSKTYLVGYSLGARWAMCFAEAYPHLTTGLLLIAPDGIIQNKWYAWFTKNFALRMLFKVTITYPTLFWKVLSLLTILGWVDKSTKKFVSHEMDTPEKRKKVYLTWVYMRAVFPHKKFLQKCSSSIQITCILGQYDRIITLKKIQKLIQNSTNSLLILPCGHSTLLEYTVKQESSIQFIQKKMSIIYEK